ncbi:MAG: TIM barrel protein [Candidatus Nanoarchaeia archaeon]
MAFSYSEKGAYYNALDPSSGNFAVNSYWRAAYLGAPTSPQTPNQIQQITGMAASGIQNIEIGVLEPRNWETIPKEHFEEIKRLGKLLIRDFEKEGKPSPISIHAPILEPTGFSENRWSETQWREQQRILADVVQKAAIVGPSTPVTVHASHFPSVHIRYDPVEAKKELEKIYATIPKDKLPAYQTEIERLKRGEIVEWQTIVDPATGEVSQVKREWVHYPKEDVLYTPETRLGAINLTFWDKSLKEIAQARNELVKIEEAKAANRISESEYERLKTFWKSEFDLAVRSAYNEAIKAYDSLAKIFPEEKAGEIKQIINVLRKVPSDYSEIANVLFQIPQPPPKFIPVEYFGNKKAAENFANAALESVKIAQAKKMPLEYAPIICIENVYPTAIGGRADSLRNLIKESREIFAEKLQSEMKMSKDKAEKLAEKLIGATWDVGHINLLKRFGYQPETLKKEVEKIAKDIKHVHISDNFGFEDVHLPPGMGNVDIKNFLKILEKEGKLGKLRGIVEAGAWVQHFKESPWPKTLQYFNMPVYGWQATPGWQEALGTYFMGTSGYAAGYGNIFPEIHFSEYGSGFSVGLPPQMPRKGERSSFSGTPMS